MLAASNVPLVGAISVAFLIFGIVMLVRRRWFAQKAIEARPGITEKARARAVRTAALTAIGFMLVGVAGATVVALTLLL